LQLHFKIKQQTLMCYGCESPVAGSVGYLTCDFEFLDSDWDAVTTTYAVFTLPEADPVMRYVVPFTDGKITEKDKVSLCEGLWDVNVIGPILTVFVFLQMPPRYLFHLPLHYRSSLLFLRM